MKYIRKFNQHSLYESYIVGAEFIKPNLSLCVQEDEVHYHRYILPPPKFLDILYSDSNGNLSYTSEVLSVSKGKTPIALCVTSTEFFGVNEKARWMSLKYMNYTTPDTGSLTQQYIKWGKSGEDITTIVNIQSLYNGGPTIGYMNVDYYNNSSQSNKCPSVIDENGNWNLSALGTVNTYVMTDIDGKNKTNKILAIATSQVNWQTDTTIDNLSDTGYAPAACCCWRYHTLGTQQGDWYLGAGGEMCMILAQKIAINTKLTAINVVYPNNCISSIYNGMFWTSNEYMSTSASFVNFDNGGLDRNYKYNEYNVLAMLQY